MNDDPKPLSNFTLAKQIAALPRTVSPMKRLFLHTLLIHRNATTGLCYPSLETIAKEMGSCPVTPKRSQRELMKMGYLTVDKVVTEAGKVNSYTINLPDTFVSSSTDSVSSSRDLCISEIHKQRNKTDNKTDINREPIALGEVVAVGNETGISEEYCRNWWASFEKAGWHTTRGVPVTRRNLRSLLVKWHENDERFKLLESKKAASHIGAIHQQQNYINPLKQGDDK